MYVPVITPWNAHRDGINAWRTLEFAEKMKTPLVRFYSLDSWGVKSQNSASVRQAQKEYERGVDPVRTTNAISARLQQALWDLPPSLTEHHAGILTLCKGMPVVLKQNEATELCATNGAQGIVDDWDCHISNDRLILDVLYVQLINPPRTMQLPGLKENVIPLTRTRKTIHCTLPANDLKVTVSREQVFVLPNFAITDFCSQGCTRTRNVVHLPYSRTHQSIYTCLSRSSSLKDTIILDGFNASYMRCGASSMLRKEFRELEMLDDITKLSDAGQLPRHVKGATRGVLLQSYLDWKGVRYVPQAVPAALNWQDAPQEDLVLSTSGPPPTDDVPENNVVCGVKRSRDTGQWTSRKKKSSNPCAVPDKSSYDINRTNDSVMTRTRRHGLIWHAENWSCAYDATLTLLYNIFFDMGAEWFTSLTDGNVLMDKLTAAFSASQLDMERLESVRDEIRDILFAYNPQWFPRVGRVGTSAADVLRMLMATNTDFGTTVSVCAACGTRRPEEGGHIINHYWGDKISLWEELRRENNRLSCLDFAFVLFSRGVHGHCPACRTPSRMVPVLRRPPPIVVIDVGTPGDATPSDVIAIPINGNVREYKLKGLVYFDPLARHFTCRYVDTDGGLWYHNGISMKWNCVQETRPHHPDVLRTCRGGSVILCLYVL